MPILEPPARPEAPAAAADSPAAAADYAALRAAAYRHLARREHSAWELRRKLQSAVTLASAAAAGKRQVRKRAAGLAGLDTVDAAALPALLDRLLAELAAAGAQSDARFAEHLGRWRFQTGRGPVKLRFELTEHQIDPALIERVMAEYEPQWRALAAQIRARKFGAAPPADYKTWARQARFLQQRGFKSEHIEPFGG